MKIGFIVFYNTKLNLQIEYLFLDDWNNLTNMHKFLKFFYNITMVAQNIFDAIDKILPIMDYLFAHLETECQNYIVKSFMAAHIDAI